MRVCSGIFVLTLHAHLFAGLSKVMLGSLRCRLLRQCSRERGMRRGTRALSDVFAGPEWLKIRVVKCEVLLFDISQIKGGKWSDVIDVPKLTIFP